MDQTKDGDGLDDREPQKYSLHQTDCVTKTLDCRHQSGDDGGKLVLHQRQSVQSCLDCREINALYSLGDDH